MITTTGYPGTCSGTCTHSFHEEQIMIQSTYRSDTNQWLEYYIWLAEMLACRNGWIQIFNVKTYQCPFIQWINRKIRCSLHANTMDEEHNQSEEAEHHIIH